MVIIVRIGLMVRMVIMVVIMVVILMLVRMSDGDVANLPEAAVGCAKKGDGEVSSAGGGDAGEEGGEGEDRGGGDGKLPAQWGVHVQTTELLP